MWLEALALFAGGAILGMGAMFKGMRAWAEDEAYSSYMVGWRLGRRQGARDAKAMGVIWVEPEVPHVTKSAEVK